MRGATIVEYDHYVFFLVDTKNEWAYYTELAKYKRRAIT